VVADLGDAAPHGASRDALDHLACVLVAVGDPEHPAASAFDVVVPDDTATSEVTAAVDANPIAATALALLLRGGERRTVTDGLVAESATYSTLQDGPEHRTWLEARARRRRPDRAAAPVRVERADGALHITFDRPNVRNAYDAATRDAVLDAFAIAAGDATIRTIVIDGAGPAFCSGGDLDEFGTFSDPASAHLLRLARSVAHAIHARRAETNVRVHGPCIGAGVELPAFAGRVVARSDATFRLPEVAMGLVPGAGGTVSVARRIGRQRLAWMAITGASVDAETALAWGLVDEIASGAFSR
jgi:enoyl-CoA hydratase/carnithine racemase